MNPFKYLMPVTLRSEFSKQYVRRFWGYGMIALFIHGVADPVVTYFSVNVYQVGIEANQWLATPLAQGAWPFFVTHLPLYVLHIGILCAFTGLFSLASSEEAEQVYRFSRPIWIGIILWGAIIVLNNVIVLFRGVI